MKPIITRKRKARATAPCQPIVKESQMLTKDKKLLFAEARSWETDRVARALSSARRAWTVAAFAGLLALVAILAVFFLTPLKTVENNLLVMDKSQGTIEPLQKLDVTITKVDEIFTKKFISDFMIARENYTYDTAEINYYTAAAFMSPQLQVQWGNFYNPNNEHSPLSIYKNDTKVNITIKSIVIHTKDSGMQDVATVRFTKLLTKGDIKTSKNYVATITYRYVNEPKEEKLMRINPIGFMIVDYRVDAEIGGQ